MALTLLVGGARSGKSRLAVTLASASALPVTFVATAEPRDGEMAERIRAHRDARPAGWTTVEEPLDLPRALDGVPGGHAIVLDCLSLWVSNMFEQGSSAERIVAGACAVAAMLSARERPAIVVSNEVGLGIVPMHPVGRAYRDALGSVNASYAAAAERTLFVVAGKVLPLVEVEVAMEP